MELKVENMTCGGCVNSVRRILVKQLGVDEATVNVDLESGRATAPAADSDKVATAIEKLARAGFPAHSVS
jgi:copper chaperone CopZ